MKIAYLAIPPPLKGEGVGGRGRFPPITLTLALSLEGRGNQ